MKNLTNPAPTRCWTKHLLLLIVIFPVIVLLFSVFAEKASAQTQCTAQGGQCTTVNVKCSSLGSYVYGGYKSPYCPDSNPQCCVSALTPTPVPSACAGVCGTPICNTCPDGTRICGTTDLNTCPSPTPSNTATPTPVGRLVWQQIAVCSASTTTPIPSNTLCVDQCQKFDTEKRKQDCLQVCDSLSTPSTPPKGCDASPTFQYKDRSYATGAEICLNGDLNENKLNCNDAAKLLDGREKGQCVNALCYYCGAIITPTLAPGVPAPTPTPTAPPTSAIGSYTTPYRLPSYATPTTISVISPTVTIVPTLTVSTSPIASCNLKNKGDGNCDNIINVSDYELWRTEFVGMLKGIPIINKPSDFNNDGLITVVDFNIWKTNFQDLSLPH